ncbi:Retrovirus-related Pol polyprotein from transposon TNT 1-94 [Gossypium australe]|uniref:Retrovirus-related Pol polyprotein from transposon TNT 1-94 n=1 Tax=Gossypium australe TaxID=47621 RepID=A0A5B6VKJ6_9ROSI|nr:Retrovirus-related Pol polyprotein from transposon TNT 1-94 [Gossypium australe]
MLIGNCTWELVFLPPRRKVKKNPDGTVARRKCRLVAKGCSQVPGCDFRETLSSVVKPTTIRTILSTVVSKNWQLRQVDVNNAFLNGHLTEEVYMQQPPGYVRYDDNGKPLVCRLTEVLYGLGQAPRALFDKLKKFLLSIRFILSKSDASLFIHVISKTIMYVLVYVDDIIIMGDSFEDIDMFV